VQLSRSCQDGLLPLRVRPHCCLNIKKTARVQTRRLNGERSGNASCVCLVLRIDEWSRQGQDNPNRPAGLTPSALTPAQRWVRRTTSICAPCFANMPLRKSTYIAPFYFFISSSTNGDARLLKNPSALGGRHRRSVLPIPPYRHSPTGSPPGGAGLGLTENQIPVFPFSLAPPLRVNRTLFARNSGNPYLSYPRAPWAIDDPRSIILQAPAHLFLLQNSRAIAWTTKQPVVSYLILGRRTCQ